jgi:hypothetical protein
MGKHGTDVDLFSIVANRGNQSNLISSNIKHCELPTRSAVGKTARSSAKFKKLPFFIVAYQRARADWVSGNLSANSFRRFRVMTCIKDGQPERSTREQSQHERENYSKHSVCSSGFLAVAGFLLTIRNLVGVARERAAVKVRGQRESGSVVSVWTNYSGLPNEPEP